MGLPNRVPAEAKASDMEFFAAAGNMHAFSYSHLSAVSASGIVQYLYQEEEFTLWRKHWLH